MFNVNHMNPLSLARGVKEFKDRDKLQRKLNEQGGWYENFYFENGATTPGRSPSPKKLMALGLPMNLSGVSILDVGAYEGFYSIHMEQRGASVTANDYFVWNFPGDNSRSNFELIREVVGSKVSILEAEIDSLPTRKHQVTLFLGVLYHLEDQIGALKKIRESATSLVVLETLLDNLDAEGPSLKFYPGNSLNNDQSNQFGPNFDALIGLIQASGYSNYEFKGIWEVNPVNTHSNLTTNHSPLKSARVVFWLYP